MVKPDCCPQQGGQIRLSGGGGRPRPGSFANRDVRLEIQFTPDADAIESAAMRPDVNFAMLEMHMDGFDPPLQLVEAGVWRANLKLPMAGRWVVSVGFGEDRAEVEFDAQ